MSGRGFSNARQLLETLLDRYERRPETTRLSAEIDIEGFRNVAERDAFDEELASLVGVGGVRLIQKGPRYERVTTAVALSDPAVLYAHLGRTPSSLRVEKALECVRRAPELTPSALAVVDRVAEAWSRGVSHVGLPPGDVTSLEHSLRLADAIRARDGSDQAVMDYRTFSRATVGDTKALERNLRQVRQILPLLHPGVFEDELQIERLLAEVGIVRLPQPLLIAGRMTIAGQTLPAMPYAGIPTETVSQIGLVERPSHLLTIENYASFIRHVREVPIAGGIIIYSGGFPSGPVLEATLSLAAAARAPTFHWGDMDPGGVRIFRHLERALAEVGVDLRPHLMSAELLAERGTAAASGIGAALKGFEDSAVAALAEEIGLTGLIHEQEDLDPISPI
ncbi:Wadjet anti-phage system protein JetD domain-containing protein [Sphingomonas colocasiae]|uniref:DUF2220 domain-containing protein n=1 Tax=Sphingomonas colocasiae TaxID=1848973 RepID=A0ABS7PQ84_9SPHN|nr:Wadjet anti-phage system protein JetD domain-containing protein [Sphingomonas colocasiae]MBY8823351.1 DUF2220 domain-containing protein [Sphingomonas colocasiae]